MAITTRIETEEVKVNKLLHEALDQGLKNEIAHMFSVLCTDSQRDTTQALGRFMSVIVAARRAYVDAKVLLEEHATP